MQRKISKMRQKQILFDQKLLLLSVPPSTLTQNWGLSLIVDSRGKKKKKSSSAKPFLSCTGVHLVKIA